MFHIKKSKNGQYFVDNIAPNGKILSSTETFKRKQSAYKNILAQSNAFDYFFPHVTVQDDTEKPAKRYLFFFNGHEKRLLWIEGKGNQDY